jgi:hypothetical protein
VQTRLVEPRGSTKSLLLLGLLTLLATAAAAQQPLIRCPGENTVEMPYCAEKSWEDSAGRSQQIVPATLQRQNSEPQSSQGFAIKS